MREEGGKLREVKFYYQEWIKERWSLSTSTHPLSTSTHPLLSCHTLPPSSSHGGKLREEDQGGKLREEDQDGKLREVVRRMGDILNHPILSPEIRYRSFILSFYC